MTTEEEVTLRIDRFENHGGFGVLVKIPDGVVQKFQSLLLHSVLREIEKRLVEMWIERHGAETLDAITPGAVAESVRTQVAKKVFG